MASPFFVGFKLVGQFFLPCTIWYNFLSHSSRGYLTSYYVSRLLLAVTAYQSVTLDVLYSFLDRFWTPLIVPDKSNMSHVTYNNIG